MDLRSECIETECRVFLVGLPRSVPFRTNDGTGTEQEHWEVELERNGKIESGTGTERNETVPERFQTYGTIYMWYFNNSL